MSFDLLGSLSPGQPADTRDSSGPDTVQCSRRGCTATAQWRLEWNNPKVHAPERRKVWTACNAHREHLAEFLRMRGFLKDVLPL
ncbi:hypothetical protein [Kocuria sp.]|uniref:hypothetical protein n=1 Tax=Kocuria sp. TaxID=1871328 RepID=UPI0026E0F9A2|nr:hypothetical protein [Kocuria sp.]MDO5617779.1 hypothetical protein [Kocuria sp.]